MRSRSYLNRSALCVCAAALLGFCQPCRGQTTADQTGLTQLQALYGNSLEDGSGVSAAIVEAFNGGSSAYLPNAVGGLAGKTFNDLGEPPTGETATTSSHATGSANNLLGPASSAPGLDNVDAFSASHWLGNGALRYGGNRLPLTHSYKVSNHSYIVTGSADFGEPEAQSLLARLDYYADQNDSLIVVGSNNGAGTTLPIGHAPAYNAIAVGRSDGSHRAGTTSFYGPGRTKVDIVAPAGSTSGATPLVASAAVLLVDAAGTTDAARLEAIKATLLAGATKDEFPDWDRTSSRPLDEVYGAGEVNVFNSYQIQRGGEFDGGSTPDSETVGHYGWDYQESLSAQNERFYQFEVQDDEYINELSIALSWNFSGGSAAGVRFVESDVSTLANLDLELTDDNGMLVDSSLSTVDNTEHLYLRDLAPGDYTLKLSTDQEASFGLAWRFDGSALAGDFNLDQAVDVDDVNFYSGNLGQDAVGSLQQLDLDDDNVITQNDLELHVTTLVQGNSGQLGVPFGDLNFDGSVDTLADAATLIHNLQSVEPLGYAEGDLNADGQVDVLSDAARLIEALPSASPTSVAAARSVAIPEPATGMVSLVAIAGYFLYRRRRG